MASIMIHFGAAYRLQQEGGLLHNKISNPASYYLGVAAPDAVNLEGFAPKEIRWEAHQRAQTPKLWYISAENFYRQQLAQEFPDKDLLLGYLVHIVTDAAFDETLHDPIWAAAAKAIRGTENPSGAGWEECFRFDRSQLTAPWWMDIVRPALAVACPQKIASIPQKLLGRFQAHLLNELPNVLPTEPPRIVTPEMVWLLGDYLETVLRPML